MCEGESGRAGAAVAAEAVCPACAGPSGGPLLRLFSWPDPGTWGGGRDGRRLLSNRRVLLPCTGRERPRT